MKELTKVKVNKGEHSVKCRVYIYYYFREIGFKYQPYVCNGFFVITIKNVDHRVYIIGADKKATVLILKNSDLSDKGAL